MEIFLKNDDGIDSVSSNDEFDDDVYDHNDDVDVLLIIIIKIMITMNSPNSALTHSLTSRAGLRCQGRLALRCWGGCGTGLLLYHWSILAVSDGPRVLHAAVAMVRADTLEGDSGRRIHHQAIKSWFTEFSINTPGDIKAIDGVYEAYGIALISTFYIIMVLSFLRELGYQRLSTVIKVYL